MSTPKRTKQEQMLLQSRLLERGGRGEYPTPEVTAYPKYAKLMAGMEGAESWGKHGVQPSRKDPEAFD
jgi:hypothetical protein